MNKLSSYDWWAGIIIVGIVEVIKGFTLSGFASSLIIFWLVCLLIKNIFE